MLPQKKNRKSTDSLLTVTAVANVWFFF